LAGGLWGLVGTAYGWVLLTKTALFTVLLTFAALNRFRFIPALLRQPSRLSLRSLVRSIAAETAVGVLVVLAAGVLSTLEPGMHAHAN
jgi:copper resistance protein D